MVILCRTKNVFTPLLIRTATVHLPYFCFPNIYLDRGSKDLVSIRHAVEDLQFMGRNFYQEQQRRYEDIQLFGREFHRLQEKRYDGLMVWIDDTARRVDRQLRKSKQLKQKIKSEPNEEEEDPDVLLGLIDHTLGGISKRDTDIEYQGAEERTLPISSTRILPRKLFLPMYIFLLLYHTSTGMLILLS